MQIFTQLATNNPANPAVQDELARAYETLADGLGRAANANAEIITNYQKSRAIREELVRRDNSNLKLRRGLALILMKLGGASDPHQPEAIAAIRRGVATLESLAAADPNNGRARREVGWGYYQLGGVLMAGGDYADALDSRQKALAIREKFSAADPQNAQASFDLAGAHVDLAEALTAKGDPVRTVEEARKGITILTTLSTADPTNVIYSRNLAVYDEKLGDAFARSGADTSAPAAERIRAWSGARETYKKAGEIFSNLRDHGTLPPVDADQPQKFAKRTSDCQRAIKQLTPVNNSP